MHKILIVDDDPTLVDFLKLLLDSEGYETYEAYDGRQALSVVGQVQPHIVLLDYMMPNMHGLDVLRNVSLHHQSSFVVMLTGKGSEEVAVECMKAGAADYVVKPFENDHLLGVLRNVVRLRESELQKRKLNATLEAKQSEIQYLLTQTEQKLAEIASITDIPQLSDIKKLLTQIKIKLNQ